MVEIITKISFLQAAKIAVDTVHRFLKDNPDRFDLVEWVLFNDQAAFAYEKALSLVQK